MKAKVRARAKARVEAKAEMRARAGCQADLRCWKTGGRRKKNPKKMDAQKVGPGAATRAADVAAGLLLWKPDVPKFEI